MLRAVVRDGAIYSLPALLSRGLGLILLPIYGRVLSRPEFGLFDLLLAVGPILNVVVCLEVQQGLARLRQEADEATRRRMTGTVWVFSTLAYLVFITAALSLSTVISDKAVGNAELSNVVRLGFVSLAIGALFNLVLNQFRWELRSRSFAAVSALYAIATVVLTVALTVIGDWGLRGVFLAQCISGAMGVATCLALLRQSWTPAFSLEQLRRILTFSLPLVPASFFVLLMLSFNRMALNYFADLGEVASYGMAARLAGLVGLLIVGLQGAVTPLVYSHYRDPTTPGQLAQLFAGVLGLCFILCLALNAFAADLVVLVAGRPYASSAGLIPLIAVALLAGQLYVLAPGMAIAQKTKSQLAVAAVSALTDVVLNIVLVPPLGARGAALAAACSSIVFLGLWLRASQRHYPIPFDWPRVFGGVAIFLAASVGAAIARIATEPLSVAGLLVKIGVLLSGAALLYQARLFQGVLTAWRT